VTRHATPSGEQVELFTLADLEPEPQAPACPPQWAGFPQGPARKGDGCWTGPCLYASPVRGLAARLAEYDLWGQVFGRFASGCDSHAWRPTAGAGWALSPADYQMDRHEPFLLDCDLRRDHWKDTPVPPCGHHGDDWLIYRCVCRLPGCDWEGPERARENPAVEDGMDHAWPGWRALPAVPRVPDYGGNPNTGTAKKQLAAWAAKVNAVYPEFWLENGGPIRTLRKPLETRHVDRRTPYGGYDLGVPADPQGHLL
jgi:hypothetical protein